MAETHLHELGLSERVYYLLSHGPYNDPLTLATTSDVELLAIRRLGPAALREIREKTAHLLEEASVARQVLALRGDVRNLSQQIVAMDSMLNQFMKAAQSAGEKREDERKIRAQVRDRERRKAQAEGAETEKELDTLRALLADTTDRLTGLMNGKS